MKLNEIGSKVSKERARVDRLERISKYRKSPKKCLHCLKVIDIPEGSNGQTVSYIINEKKFCNRSCAAKTNNRGVRRHCNPDNWRCNECQSPLTTSSKYCNECRSFAISIGNRDRVFKVPIEDRLDKIETLIESSLSDEERSALLLLPKDSEVWRMLYSRGYVSPSYRVCGRFQKALREAYRAGGKVSVIHSDTFDLLGYSSLDAYNHLHSFDGSMCLDCSNIVIEYSIAHIDHIVPLSSGSSVEEYVELFGLPNLRLVCANCNFIKAAK